MKECSYCAEFITKEEEFSLFHKISNELFSSRIIWENEYFLLTPTIGCFLSGYVLLIPKRHISSFGNLNEKEQDNLDIILPQILTIIRNEYGGAIFFEHGSVTACQKGGGACEDHAHLHIIPSDLDFSSHVKKLFSPIKISSFQDLKDYELKGHPYLMFSSPIGNIFVCEAFDIVSQYLRQISTIMIGIPTKWNWRNYHFIENMQTTYNTLKKNKTLQKL